jgi:serine phosphatase RsbU (regulator of sigma subunit)
MNLRRLLQAVESAPPVDVVDALARELGRTVGADHVSLLIANFSGSAVVRMSHVVIRSDMVAGANERTESLALAGTPYQEVLSSQSLRIGRRDGSGDVLVLVPVTERGDAIGVLELVLPRAPDDDTASYLQSAAHALAYVLIASRRHADLFEWAQRDIPFSLAAEIQRRLLPDSYTLEAGPLTVAGWLEPAHQVGGDTFDYALDRDYLYASITDAMGHEVDAALLATLAVGSIRNSRRSSATPAEQASRANRALLDHARPDQFVTGQLLRTRLADGVVELVNGGHPGPILIREGERVDVRVPANPAFGVTDADYETVELQLRPGDRLVLVTDGFLERRAAGLDIVAILVGTGDRHPREVVRELAAGVMQATGGKLRDDAAVLCIDWYGSSADRTGTTGGASQDRATGAPDVRADRAP